jgi:hypothetical protein
LIVPLSFVIRSLDAFYVALDARLPLALGNRSYVSVDLLGAAGVRF